MKYELQGIDDWQAGETQLLLKDKVFIRLATIPWAREKRSTLWLNPRDIANVPAAKLSTLSLMPEEKLPTFDAVELQTVIATVVMNTKRIQALDRKPFTYISDSYRRVAKISDLVLKAVVLPGEKTSEGTMVEAVAIPWFEILKLLQENPNLAFEIPARKWEEIIAGAYKKAGFDNVILTPRSGDLGRDVIAEKIGLGTVRVIDQVKAYKPGHLVTADDVRALYGVLMADDRSSKGYLTTTSDFAPKLRDDALIKPLIPGSLELINGTELLKRLEFLSGTKAL